VGTLLLLIKQYCEILLYILLQNNASCC